MAFITEPTGYEKTALSDLQGAWGNLRDAVVKNFGFPNSDKLMFHINEAMSWELVRNLQQMKATLLIIQNISVQAKVPEEVTELIEDVRQDLEVVFDEIAKGNIT